MSKNETERYFISTATARKLANAKLGDLTEDDMLDIRMGMLELAQASQVLDQVEDMLNETPELNMSNYSHDDVDTLNGKIVEIALFVQGYQQDTLKTAK